jgi:hypothetical protein
MRFRTHLLTSALLGLALYPRRPGRAAAVALAGTLVDLDHLLLYGAHTGDWSVAGALRYDRYRHRRRVAGDTRPRYGSLRSWLHAPWLVLPPLWAAAAARPALRPVALGISLHLLLDHWDGPVRLAVRLRRGRSCERCGRRGLRLGVYRYGRLGGYRYRVLCHACAEVVASLPAGALWYTDRGARPDAAAG